jgi:hypothetical protein
MILIHAWYMHKFLCVHGSYRWKCVDNNLDNTTRLVFHHYQITLFFVLVPMFGWAIYLLLSSGFENTMAFSVTHCLRMSECDLLRNCSSLTFFPEACARSLINLKCIRLHRLFRLFWYVSISSIFHTGKFLLYVYINKISSWILQISTSRCFINYCLGLPILGSYTYF